MKNLVCLFILFAAHVAQAQPATLPIQRQGPAVAGPVQGGAMYVQPGYAQRPPPPGFYGGHQMHHGHHHHNQGPRFSLNIDLNALIGAFQGGGVNGGYYAQPQQQYIAVPQQQQQVIVVDPNHQYAQTYANGFHACMNQFQCGNQYGHPTMINGAQQQFYFQPGNQGPIMLSPNYQIRDPNMMWLRNRPVCRTFTVVAPGQTHPLMACQNPQTGHWHSVPHDQGLVFVQQQPWGPGYQQPYGPIAPPPPPPQVVYVPAPQQPPPQQVIIVQQQPHHMGGHPGMQCRPGVPCPRPVPVGNGGPVFVGGPVGGAPAYAQPLPQPPMRVLNPPPQQYVAPNYATGVNGNCMGPGPAPAICPARRIQ